MANITLTENEVQVMEILWCSGVPLTKAAVVSLSPDEKSWKDSSIHIILNSLLKKRAIREAGFVRSGKVFARTFEPLILREEYYSDIIHNSAKGLHIPTFLSALIENVELSPSDIQEIEEIIERKKPH